MLFWHKKHIFLLILWNLHVFIFSEQLDYCLDYCLYGEFLWERKLSAYCYICRTRVISVKSKWLRFSFLLHFICILHKFVEKVNILTLVYVFTLQCGKHTIIILFINLTFLIRIIFRIITKITHNSIKCKSRLKATIWLPFARSSSLRK